MIDLSKLGLGKMNLSFLPPTLLGRLGFQHQAPSQPALPAGQHLLGLADERDTVLIVPEGLDPTRPVPLLVMFHGASGSAEKVRPFLEKHALKRRFLLLLPQSTYVTWDLSIGGNGPDLDRLDRALSKVAAHFPVDQHRFGFAGFSDGASYTLSIGLTNGDRITHLMAMSGGYMNLYQPNGKPLIFIAHSPEDEQLPIQTSGRKHASMLKEAGYDVDYVEFSGHHVIHTHVVEQAIDFFLKKDKPGSA